MYSQWVWRARSQSPSPSDIWTAIVPMFDDSTKMCSTDISSSGCWWESLIMSSANFLRHGTTKVESGVTVPWLRPAAIVITFATEPGS